MEVGFGGTFGGTFWRYFLLTRLRFTIDEKTLEDEISCNTDIIRK